jgi:parallel beta-helix repeat protein
MEMRIERARLADIKSGSRIRIVGRFMMLRTFVAIVAAAGLAATMTGPALAIGGDAAACGDAITANTTLANDLTNCPGDGLVVAADDITLNLNGHTIDGDAVPGIADFDVGIRVAGHHGVTITDGHITEFDLGVGLTGSTGNTINSLTVNGNQRRGIQLADGSNGNRIERNIANHNSRSGIALLDSAHNLITGNTSDGNLLTGIFVVSSSQNRITHNLVAHTGGIALTGGSNRNVIDDNDIADFPEFGIEINVADGNVVTHNRVRDMAGGIGIGGDDNVITGNTISGFAACEGCGIGVQMGAGSNNLIAGNRVTGQARYGIEVDGFGGEEMPSVGTVIRDNIVRASGVGIGIGIEFAGPVRNTLVEGNVTIGSAGDGIFVAGPPTGTESTTVTRNVANHNGDFGIEALPGVIDGGGNHAAGNGNPLECLNVSC